MKRILLCVFALLLLVSGLQASKVFDNYLMFNASKDDSSAYVLIRLQVSNDTIFEIDTIGTFRFLCPYVIDSIHTADSINTDNIVVDEQAVIDTATVLKRIYAISSKNETTFIWTDTSGVFVLDDTHTSYFEPNLWECFANSCADSSFEASGSMSFVGKGDTASGNNEVIIEVPINLQVQGEFAGDGVVPNYWLGIKRGTAEPFIKFYGSDTTYDNIAMGVTGTVRVEDSTSDGNDHHSVYIRTCNTGAGTTSGLKVETDTACGGAYRIGVNSHSMDTVPSTYAIGVLGVAETLVDKWSLLMGGQFKTGSCGSNKRYGLKAEGYGINDSTCYGLYSYASQESLGAAIAVYAEANNTGGGEEIAVYAEGANAVIADGFFVADTKSVVSASPMTCTMTSMIVTGGNNIDSIPPARAGTFLLLKFSGDAAGQGVIDGKNLLLENDANFSYTANDILFLWCDGSDWYEISRSTN